MIGPLLFLAILFSLLIGAGGNPAAFIGGIVLLVIAVPIYLLIRAASWKP